MIVLIGAMSLKNILHIQKTDFTVLYPKRYHVTDFVTFLSSPLTRFTTSCSSCEWKVNTCKICILKMKKRKRNLFFSTFFRCWSLKTGWQREGLWGKNSSDSDARKVKELYSLYCMLHETRIACDEYWRGRLAIGLDIFSKGWHSWRLYCICNGWSGITVVLSTNVNNQ